MRVKRRKDMKKVLSIAVCLLLFASIATAGTWCQWNGSEGENCKTTDLVYIRIGDHPVTVAKENLNPFGWYELTITEPTVGADQIKNEMVWSFENNEIGLTWTVRDLTAQEIQDRDDLITAEEGLISRELYYVLRWLINENVITSTNVANAPAALRDAYQARGRLEN
jgi:hypothetical protein